jgi:hypothetical protein
MDLSADSTPACASGVGKSSVAQAGVLSALKSMRWPGAKRAAISHWPDALRDCRAWAFLSMRPGNAPLQALVAAFIQLWQLDLTDPKQASRQDEWTKGLLAGKNSLRQLIDATQDNLKQREGEAPARVLLYLDQGEELYTRAASQEAKRFTELLAEGIADLRLSVFASMRADFFHRLQADTALFSCYEHVDVPPLGPAKLLEVVTAPANALDVTFEDEKLADRLTATAADEPGALPLLSYLWTDMWAGMEKYGHAVMRLPSQAIDVGGVLAHRAETFLAAHPGEENALQRLLTLKLAAVPQEGEPVRRQADRAECSDEEWALAGRLADHPCRLVVISQSATDGRVFAEVAHEAFLRSWPRLTQWLYDERVFLVFKAEVEREERQWRELNRADEALLTGLNLSRAEQYLPLRPQDLSPDVAAFVQRSIAKDREEKQRQLAEKERQLRFQRLVSFAAAIGAVVMAAVGGTALYLWSRATTAEQATNRALVLALENQNAANAALVRARENESRGLAALSVVAAKDGSFVDSTELALAGWPRTSADPRPRLAPILDALAFGLSTLVPVVREYRHQGFVYVALLNRDESRILSWSDDGSVRLWDVVTPSKWKPRRAVKVRQIGPAMMHFGSVVGARLNHDESRILSWSVDRRVRLWDVATGQQIGPAMMHEGFVNGALLNRDESRILSWSDDKSVRLWDVATGRQIGPAMLHEGSVVGALLIRDESRILSWSADKSVRLWNAAWRGRNLLEIACNHSPPGHDLSSVSARYGIKIAEPICQLDKVIPIQ